MMLFVLPDTELLVDTLYSAFVVVLIVQLLQGIVKLILSFSWGQKTKDARNQRPDLGAWWFVLHFKVNNCLDLTGKVPKALSYRNSLSIK